VTANTIVTGGSRGLGLEIVSALAAEGRQVIAVSRKSSPELQATIAAYAGTVHFESFDFANTGEIDIFVKSLRSKHGTIAALVNNAAVGIDGVLTTLKNDDIEAAIKINLLAPILLTKAIAKTMMATGGGNIVNISSVNAFTGYSGLSAYAATKAGLIGFTKSLARELGRAGIRVNAVAPGLLETGMVSAMSSEQRDRIRRRSALKRFATTAEVANAVMFLLSDNSAGLTGTVTTVDAGNSA
jgi:3-oxoacyl-[acyl-carrier protein] reductase